MGSSSILQKTVFKLSSPPRSLWFGDLFGICSTTGMFLTGLSDTSCSLLYTADTSTTSCIHLCKFLLNTKILSIPIPSFLPLPPSPIPFVPSSLFLLPLFLLCFPSSPSLPLHKCLLIIFYQLSRLWSAAQTGTLPSPEGTQKTSKQERKQTSPEVCFCLRYPCT